MSTAILSFTGDPAVVDVGQRAAVLTDFVITPSGPPGAAGQAGGSDIPLTAQSDDVVSAGMAVYINRTTQHFAKAIANDQNAAIVVGLAMQDTAIGFALNAQKNILTLQNWTAVIGQPTLTPGFDYFLSPTVAGQLTTVPPVTTGQLVVFIGTATSPTTLALELAEPVLL